MLIQPSFNDLPYRLDRELAVIGAGVNYTHTITACREIMDLDLDLVQHPAKILDRPLYHSHVEVVLDYLGR
jgi:hypothetical protein